MPTPESIKCVAKQCLRVCAVPFWVIPAICAAFAYLFSSVSQFNIRNVGRRSTTTFTHTNRKERKAVLLDFAKSQS